MAQSNKFVCRGDATALCAPSVSSPAPLFASLGWGAASSTPIQAIREPRTGTAFPGEFCFRAGQRNCPRVTGAGARTKKIAGIKSIDIYSLALYVDEGVAGAVLRRRYANAAPEAVAKDSKLFDELKNVEKTLVLVITSGLVKRKNFLEALNERLAPAMAKVGEDAALEEFKAQFDAVEFRKGLEIAFNFAGGRLVTRANGKTLKTMNSRAMADTLLDLYVGSNPVSPGAKKAFAEGLARLAAAHA